MACLAEARSLTLEPAHERASMSESWLATRSSFATLTGPPSRFALRWAPFACNMSEGWRKRLGVEPSPRAKTRTATDFEDREGHRAPFTSVGQFYRRCQAG